jgi:hypothetical protein
LYPERLMNYFPGPNFWHAKESPDAPEHHETSGVVQPPIHATAVLYVYRHAQDEANAKDFLEYASSPPRIVRPVVRTTASLTWSNSSKTATTTRRR